MRKWISLLVVLALISLPVSGCGTGPPADDFEPPAPTENDGGDEEPEPG
jgi:hypothetical protein